MTFPNFIRQIKKSVCDFFEEKVYDFRVELDGIREVGRQRELFQIPSDGVGSSTKGTRRRLGPISKVSLERRQRVLPLRWAVVPRYIRDRQVRGCSSDSPRIYGGPDGSFSADMTGQGRVETLLRTLCACANATIRKYLVKNRLSNAIDWPI